MSVIEPMEMEHVYDDVSDLNEVSTAEHKVSFMPGERNDTKTVKDMYLMPIWENDDTTSKYSVNKGRSNTEYLSRGYITVKQFRLLIGLLLFCLVAAICSLGIAAFLIRKHVLAELSGPYTNGVWKSWQGWTDCSTSCGEGTRVRVRQCDNIHNDCPGSGIDQQMCNLRKCAAAFQSKIGFTATSMSKKKYIKDEIIIFTKVITNDGNGYDSETGLFTCPTSGLFLFSFTVGTLRNHRASATLIANGEQVVKAVAESQADDHDPQSSNVVILRLRAGDRVSVRTDSNHDILETIPGYTTFAGVYLYD